jgi:hypothetical protein
VDPPGSDLARGGHIKGLTLTQPWASLAAHGLKKVETRDWGTSYRGILLIHAARGFPRPDQDLCQEPPFRKLLAAAGFAFASDPRATPMAPGRAMPRGAILATARLADCYRLETAADLKAARARYSRQEQALGHFAVGRVLWLLADVTRLAAPLPWRGALGLWPVSRQEQAQITAWMEETGGQLSVPASAR